MSARPCCRDVYRLLRYRYVGVLRPPTAGSLSPRSDCRDHVEEYSSTCRDESLGTRAPQFSQTFPRAAYPPTPLTSIHPCCCCRRSPRRPPAAIAPYVQASSRSIGVLRRASTHRSFFAIRFSLNNKRWSSPVVFPLTRHPRPSQMRRGDIPLGSSSLLQSAFGIHLLML